MVTLDPVHDSRFPSSAGRPENDVGSSIGRPPSNGTCTAGGGHCEHPDRIFARGTEHERCPARSDKVVVEIALLTSSLSIAGEKYRDARVAPAQILGITAGFIARRQLFEQRTSRDESARRRSDPAGRRAERRLGAGDFRRNRLCARLSSFTSTGCAKTARPSLRLRAASITSRSRRSSRRGGPAFLHQGRYGVVRRL